MSNKAHHRFAAQRAECVYTCGVDAGRVRRQPGLGSGGIGEGFESIGRFTVNGGRDSSNAIMMDGVPVTVNSNTANMNANTAVPTIEGVEESRIQTNSYSAEYGRSGGGVLTIATKTGTNAIHGSLFEFLRNSKMDANNNFFANASNRPLGVFGAMNSEGALADPLSFRASTKVRTKRFSSRLSKDEDSDRL